MSAPSVEAAESLSTMTEEEAELCCRAGVEWPELALLLDWIAALTGLRGGEERREELAAVEGWTECCFCWLADRLLKGEETVEVPVLGGEATPPVVGGETAKPYEEPDGPRSEVGEW